MEKINQEDFEVQAFETEKVENNDIKGKRKINVRFGYITKIKYYFRKFLTSYYANKHQDILESKEDVLIYSNDKIYQSDLKDAEEARDRNNEKMQEHEQRLREMEILQRERTIEKKNLAYERAMDKAEVNPTAENIAKVAGIEAELASLNMENTQAILRKNVQEIKNQDSEPTLVNNDMSDTKEIVTEQVQPVSEGTLESTKEIPTEEIEAVQQTISETSVNEPVENSEVKNENVTEVSQNESVVPESSVSEPVAPVEVSESKENVVADGDINALFENFKQFTGEFNKHWNVTVQSLTNCVEKYNKACQETALKTLANKQKEVNTLSNLNQELTNEKNQLNSDLSKSQEEVASLTKSNQEKDSKIQSLMVENENKDREIEEVTTLYNDQLRNNAALTDENTKLKNDVLAMSQQFKQMQEMFNNFQSMMGASMQQSSTPVAEEVGNQKIK